MSRIYRALEKAEEERKQKVKEKHPLELFEEKSVSKKETTKLRLPEEKIESWGFLPKEGDPVLIVPPDSFGAEAFRKLKSQIFLHSPNPPHSILITSSAPQEGKTMVAVNLAMAISEEIHSKVILIDGDLRKPGIHLEKSQNVKGLSNYLSNGTPISEILAKPETEKIQIIMAGPSTRKSSELIRSKRMEELMKYLKELGDNTYIVIDSPPIMATADPIVLSKIVDGVILVIKAGRTSRESIQSAIKSIGREKIIGVVFNQVDIKPSAHFSEYYRYYRYYRQQI